MPIRQLSISKVLSVIFLIITACLFVVNIFNYLTAGSFASPLMPRSSLEKISRTYLIFAIILILFLVIAFLFHKRRKYIISIFICTFVLILLNYFPELFV